MQLETQLEMQLEMQLGYKRQRGNTHRHKASQRERWITRSGEWQGITR